MTDVAARHRRLRDLARGASEPPALPTGALDALRLARDPGAVPDAIVRLADQHPSLARRLLGLAGAMPERGDPAVSTVRAAVARLGVEAARDVLHEVAYAAMLTHVPGFEAEVEETFLHGVTTAKIARGVARMTDADAAAAYVAGLLHDLGRPRCLRLVVERAPQPDAATTRAAVDALHAEVGARLADAWHLPVGVAEVCATHHAPVSRLALVVAAADALAEHVEARADRATVERALRAAGVPGSVDALVGAAAALMAEGRVAPRAAR